jgi:DNA-binding SARP family transcriptional activator
LSRLPGVPAQRLEISVLGPLRVSFDGVPVAPVALRRARVRTLLALLVVHRTLNRDRVIDLLWPDLDVADGARNLRVTLTYLRQLIEPDRLRGEASFHLRADGSTISLHASDHLQVDLWELQRMCREAARSRDEAVIDRAITLLAAATSLWRGQPLSDLATVADHEVEIERARLLHLVALLEVGELQLTQGRAAESLVAAERALELDPYSERAHCLAVSAALHSRDRARTATTARRLLVTLMELGVEPAPATRILLRQARVRPG